MSMRMLKACSRSCAVRQNTYESMTALAAAARECSTREGYAAFLSRTFPAPVEVILAEDGILLKLHKSGCTCPVASALERNTDMMCGVHART